MYKSDSQTGVLNHVTVYDDDHKATRRHHKGKLPSILNMIWSLLMILLHDQLTTGVIEKMLDYEVAFNV